jgi:hypothetical protein
MRAILCVLFLGLSNAALAAPKADPVEQYVRKVFERITGTPILQNDPRLARMKQMMTNGQFEEAARIATADFYFYQSTLKNLSAPMSDREKSAFTPLNDFQAMFIGITRDDLDARLLLSGDFRYEIAPGTGIPPFSISNNDHYRQAEDMGLGLKDNLMQVSPQYSGVAGFERYNDAAGVLTLRTWVSEHVGDTNRRAVEFALQEFLCVTKYQWMDRGLNDFRVRRDINRNHGGNPATYQNECRSCHAILDGLSGAFAKMDFVNGTFKYYFNRVAPLMNKNADMYPEGYKTVDDSWINQAIFNHNTALGFRGPLEGYGVKTFGTMLGNSKAFGQCMAKRIFKEVCRTTEPTQDYFEQMGQSFESGGYKLRSLFASIAVSEPCLGPRPDFQGGKR